MSKFLIVGLGNIGDEYVNTRHNIGFSILDFMAKEAEVKFSTDRLAEVTEIKFKGKTLKLIKPSTYMNLSGKAYNYWLKAEKIEIQNSLVLVDELALPFGKIRIGPKGSDGGHNGLKNIQEILGTTNYPRLRFGISNTFNKGNQSNYVLGKWNEEEQKILQEKLKFCSDAIKAFAFIGLERCMNQFNKA